MSGHGWVKPNASGVKDAQLQRRAEDAGGHVREVNVTEKVVEAYRAILAVKDAQGGDGLDLSDAAVETVDACDEALAAIKKVAGEVMAVGALDG